MRPQERNSHAEEKGAERQKGPQTIKCPPVLQKCSPVPQSCGAFILVEGDRGKKTTSKNSKHANVFKSGGDKDIKRMKIGLCCLEVVEVSSKSCIKG